MSQLNLYLRGSDPWTGIYGVAVASRISHTTIALGAVEIADRRNADGTGWMVLTDSAGNRFCIVRSDQERTS